MTAPPVDMADHFPDRVFVPEDESQGCFRHCRIQLGRREDDGTADYVEVVQKDGRTYTLVYWDRVEGDGRA